MKSPHITPVSVAAQVEALELALARLETDDRRQQVELLLAAAQTTGGPLEGLLGAYRGGRLVGAGLAQTQPGRTAAVWVPHAIESEPPETANRLLAAIDEWLAARGVRLAQVLLAAPTASDEHVLRAQGFNRLADLLYLVSLAGQFPASPPNTQLAFEPYDASNYARLARIVEETYEATRDYPRLNGVRAIDDVLAGYRATGVFVPHWWLLVRHEQRDIGCLLLADHPRHENVELVYMGVGASFRGRNWGIEIARHAQWLARLAGRPRLVLAVDAANEPALRMYAAAGFRAWDRRSVYVRVFPGLGTEPGA